MQSADIAFCANPLASLLYSSFFKKYEKTIVSDVSNAVNDASLNFNGVEEGSASYGMVVDLAVAYYKANPDTPKEP
jgi:hypothetical protein